MTRKEAIAVLQKSKPTPCRGDGKSITHILQLSALEMAIKALEQEPKIGHWITENMSDGDVAYRCSKCNELFWLECGTPKDNEYNFCPKCGEMLIDQQESEE